MFLGICMLDYEKMYPVNFSLSVENLHCWISCFIFPTVHQVLCQNTLHNIIESTEKVSEKEDQPNYTQFWNLISLRKRQYSLSSYGSDMYLQILGC